MREKKNEIKDMGEMELDNFAHVVSLSRVNQEAKDELNEAIRNRQVELDKQVSVEAVASEIKADY